MKPILPALFMAGLAMNLFLLPAPAAWAGEHLAQEGYYLSKDFPLEQIIANNYEAVWLSERNKLQLRSFVRLLGKERLGEDQYRAHILYKRHDRPDIFRDEVLIKKLDTDVWIMSDANPPAAGSPSLNRILTQTGR